MKSRGNQLKIQVHKNSWKFLVPEFSRKGQLKIQEMAFMLVALILFFVLIGLFALSIWSNNIKESATEIAEEKTLSAITNLAGTAEFICPDTKSNCVDADKVMALIGKKNYESFWEFTSLKILRSSGFDKKESEMTKCNLGNYPNCDVIEIYDSGVSNEKIIGSFVALCRRAYENKPYTKCEIAQLWAGSERK